MQYGHCVVKATPSAISSLYFTGIAPSAIAALSKAQNAFIPSGALASRSFSLARFFLSYISGPPSPYAFCRENVLDFYRTGDKRADYNCRTLGKAILDIVAMKLGKSNLRHWQFGWRLSFGVFRQLTGPWSRDRYSADDVPYRTAERTSKGVSSTNEARATCHVLYRVWRRWLQHESRKRSLLQNRRQTTLHRR